METVNKPARESLSGFSVNPLVAAAVPAGDCLVRMSLMAMRTPEPIDFALSKLEKIGVTFGII